MNIPNISAEPLYKYWFGQPETSSNYIKQRAEIWFQKNEAVDGYIQHHFSFMLSAYERKLLDHWNTDLQSQISMIILLDQIPRHIFRNSPRAHQFDVDVSAMSLHLIQSNIADQLNAVELLFLYMPLQHSEMPALQNLSVKKFTELLHRSPIEWKDFFLVVLEMAKLHHEVIHRFGRFPHRNKYLGRSSTYEELELLKDPKYNF